MKPVYLPDPEYRATQYHEHTDGIDGGHGISYTRTSGNGYGIEISLTQEAESKREIVCSLGIPGADYELFHIMPEDPETGRPLPPCHEIYTDWVGTDQDNPSQGYFKTLIRHQDGEFIAHRFDLQADDYIREAITPSQTKKAQEAVGKLAGYREYIAEGIHAVQQIEKAAAGRIADQDEQWHWLSRTMNEKRRNLLIHPTATLRINHGPQALKKGEPPLPLLRFDLAPYTDLMAGHVCQYQQELPQCTDGSEQYMSVTLSQDGEVAERQNPFYGAIPARPASRTIEHRLCAEREGAYFNASRTFHFDPKTGQEIASPQFTIDLTCTAEFSGLPLDGDPAYTQIRQETQGGATHYFAYDYNYETEELSFYPARELRGDEVAAVQTVLRAWEPLQAGFFATGQAKVTGLEKAVSGRHDDEKVARRLLREASLVDEFDELQRVCINKKYPEVKYGPEAFHAARVTERLSSARQAQMH